MRTALLAVVAAVLLAPTPAAASVVSAVSGYATVPGDGAHIPDSSVTRVTVTLTAGAGETNDVTTLQQGAELVLTDAAGLQAGAGCTSRSATEAVCSTPGVQPQLTADLGDGDDRITQGLPAQGSFGDPAPDVRVALGPGDDVAMGGFGRLDGGPGADRLTANGILVGGPGPDSFDRPAGTALATLDYSDRSAPVRVTPGDGLPDGEEGEGDQVGPGPWNVIGGTGDDDLAVGDGDPSRPPISTRLAGGVGADTLRAGTNPGQLDGGPGSDTLIGGPAADTLMGGLEADELRGGDGDDLLQAGPPVTAAPSAEQLKGGPGRDRLEGTAGPDLLIPGPGSDLVVGFGGRDDIQARDDELDRINCVLAPPLAGVTVADRQDAVRGCVRVDRPDGRPGLQLITGPSTPPSRGGFEASAACSQSCRARFRLSWRGRQLIDRTVTLRPDRQRSLRLQIGKRRLLRLTGRRQICGREVRLVVTAGEAQIIRHPIGAFLTGCLRPTGP